MNGDPLTVALRRAVVAVEIEGGAVVYVYGWTEDVSHDMERHEVRGLGVHPYLRAYDDPEYTTTVRWAQPPTQSMRYPTDADFARALPANRQLGQGAPAGAARTESTP